MVISFPFLYLCDSWFFKKEIIDFSTSNPIIRIEINLSPLSKSWWIVISYSLSIAKAFYNWVTIKKSSFHVRLSSSYLCNVLHTLLASFCLTRSTLPCNQNRLWFSWIVQLLKSAFRDFIYMRRKQTNSNCIFVLFNYFHSVKWIHFIRIYWDEYSS